MGRVMLDSRRQLNLVLMRFACQLRDQVGLFEEWDLDIDVDEWHRLADKLEARRLPEQSPRAGSIIQAGYSSFAALTMRDHRRMRLEELETIEELSVEVALVYRRAAIDVGAVDAAIAADRSSREAKKIVSVARSKILQPYDRAADHT